MNRALVEDLVCPLSRDPLRLEGDASVVQTGRLVCDGCGAAWDVERGVPRLVPPDLVDQQKDTAAAFGWAWQHFPELHPEHEAQFLDWVHPLTPEDFRGKRVLDAGCGKGRHVHFAASFGAAEVVGLDLSPAVEAARVNVASHDNVDIVQGDLLRPPFRTPEEGGGFDIIFSVGVLHHLPDPFEGFKSLVRFLRPGGTIAVWLYGHENNGFVRNVVEPLRRVSTRLSPSLLRAGAWPLALGFHGVAKAIYRPLAGTTVGRALPLSEYLASVADFSFRHNYAIVFDQLVAPTAVYIRGTELRRWFEECELQSISVSHRHQNSWRGQGTAAASTTPEENQPDA